MVVSLNQMDYGRLVDPYSGSADLKAGLIRVLHDQSFLDDATRILRAIRFEQRFGFKLEKRTAVLMKAAVDADALKTVNPHRLYDELVVLLKEPSPLRCITRLEEVCGFFELIGIKKEKLLKADFELMNHLNTLLAVAGYKFSRFRMLDSWLIYLIAAVVKLPRKNIVDFLERFGFKKGERLRVLAAKDNLAKIEKLKGTVKPHVVYSLLNPLSFETILFFYGYYRQDKGVCYNMEYFMTHLVNTKLKITGDDLKAKGIKPELLYTRVMEGVLYAKLDRGFSTKIDELNEAVKIYEKIK
jgi:tRNA nucleotidyltransferase (CCA-adding enzyme)